MKRRNFMRGWSLLETVICMTLSATLAWAAIPRVGYERVRTDAKLLGEILRGIRHRAIVERREFTVYYQSGVCSVTPAQPGLVGLCQRLKTNNPGTVTFYINGVTTPTTLALGDVADSFCTVAISLRGRVRVTCRDAKEDKR